MKFFLLLCSFLLLGLMSCSTSQKSSVTLSQADIPVMGNCGMCKSRIEKAAMTAGAKTAVWNAGTETLSVSFDPAKTSTDKIEMAVSAAGHDTAHHKAAEAAYSGLPGCCKYRNGGHKH